MAIASLYPSWVVAKVWFSLPAFWWMRKLSCPIMPLVWLICRHWEPDLLHRHREPLSVRPTTLDWCKPKVRMVRLSSIKLVRIGPFRLRPLARFHQLWSLPLPFVVPIDIRPIVIKRFGGRYIWQVRLCECVPQPILQGETPKPFRNVLDASWESPRV